MTQEELKELSERVVSGIATDEELLLYNRLYNALDASSFSPEELKQEKGQIKKEVLNAILSKISVEKPVRSIAWLRWAAVAAVFVLILSSSMYLFLNTKHDASSAVIKDADPKPSNSITPGSNRATLTFSDGKIITLDEKSDDTLVQQGRVKVIKLSSGMLSYKGNKESTGFNTITTPVGGQYRLILADGSQVWLNAASSLRFPVSFERVERIVELTGEGYFEVAHNAAKPFQVKINEMVVEVLGTHFNINSYTDESVIRTTLLEGSVRIRKEEQQLVLKPKEQAVLPPGQATFKKLTNVNLDEIIAWKEGRFRFHQMPIDAIMRQVARWYDVSVEYRGIVSKERFSGDVSRLEDVQQLLDILKATGMVSFQLEGKKIIVTSLK